MKKSIEYYQHYANADRHPKFMYLRMKFGWEGEGKFWALNNAIAESNGCKLDLNEVYNRIAIANRLDFDLDGFDQFIAFLVLECKLLILEEGLLYSGITQENYRTVMKERKKARERKLRRKEDKKICKKKFGRTFEESKVNEIKEKEIKGEGIKENAPVVFSPPPIIEIPFEEVKEPQAKINLNLLNLFTTSRERKHENQAAYNQRTNNSKSDKVLLPVKYGSG